MKKFLLSFLALFCTLALSLSPFALAAGYGDNFADVNDDLADYSSVYVSASGSDSFKGNESAPFGTLSYALEKVCDGGTINISGTVSLNSSFSWPKYNKSVIITGGTLSIASSAFNINGDVTFQNITLTFPSGGNVFANGNKVVFGEGVTNTNQSLNLFGGANGGTVAKTDLTVLSGNYTRIYGGGNGGSVTGDTNLTVGGTANSVCDPSSHSATFTVFGGGNGNKIGGSANLIFKDSAKANYIYGGSTGSAASIGEACNTDICGGSTMSINGGSLNASTSCDVNLKITGGSCQQILGASTGGSLTGNVVIKVLGGTITRRIYGGCYNEYTSSGWQSSNYVIGNIDLVISGNANITFSYSDADRSIYAHSRQKTNSSTEVSRIIFADASGYSSYKNKLKYQDTGLDALKVSLMLGSLSAADSTHYYTYSSSGATITQYCEICKNSKTATLSLDESISRIYSGKEIKPAKVACDFEFEPISSDDIAYSNNKNAGTASASISSNGQTADLSFEILNAEQNAPEGISAVNETIKGKNDGRLIGLTAAYEISSDGKNYAPVEDLDGTLPNGTYYIRFPAKTNYNASAPVILTIEEGRPLLVTFKAENHEDIIKEVSFGETLTDIPEIPQKAGWEETAPVWSVSDFSNIHTDITATAIYKFTLTFYQKNGNVIGKIITDTNITEQDLIDNGISAPEIFGYNYIGWSEDITSLSADTAIYATYERATDDSTECVITLKAEGAESTTIKARFDDYLTAKADPANANGIPFSHWENESGDVISHSAEYNFYAPSSITLTAVYGESAPKLSEIILNEAPLYKLVNNKFDIAFTARTQLPEGAVVSEKGILIGGVYFADAPDALTLENNDQQGAASQPQRDNYMITLSKVKAGRTRIVRAYVVYELGGETFAKYSASAIKIITGRTSAEISTIKLAGE